jgi:hypothetical protein
MRIDGSCHCGAIAFEAEADPEKTTICHCTDCQTITGSAFRVNIPVAGTDLKLLRGEPARYLKTTAESGNPRLQAFCPICGTQLWATAPGDNPPVYMLRTGMLRQKAHLAPKVQNWFRSARPWITEIAAVPRNEKGR